MCGMRVAQSSRHRQHGFRALQEGQLIEAVATYTEMYRPGVVGFNVADMRRWLRIVNVVQCGKKRTERYFYLWKEAITENVEMMVADVSRIPATAIIRIPLTGNAVPQSPPLLDEQPDILVDAVISVPKMTQALKGLSGVITLSTDDIAVTETDWQFKSANIPYRQALDIQTRPTFTASETPQWKLNIRTDRAQNVLDTIGDSATDDDTRPMLACINIMVDHTNVAITTADGFRLATWSAKISQLRREDWAIEVKDFQADDKKGYAQHELNVPAHALLAFLRALPARAKHTRICIEMTENKDYRIEWLHQYGHWVMAGRAVPGSYPGYRAVLETSKSFEAASVAPDVLSDQLDRAYAYTLEMFAKYEKDPRGNPWQIKESMPEERRDPALLLYADKEEPTVIKSVKEHYEDKPTSAPPYAVWFHYKLLKSAVRAMARYGHIVKPVLTTDRELKISDTSAVHFHTSDGRATWVVMPLNYENGMSGYKRWFYMGEWMEETDA